MLCCSLKLRENSERIFQLYWTSLGEIWCYLYLWICIVLTLTTRCPRTTLLCCIIRAVAYIWELCCLDSDHEVNNWICCCIQVLKELLNKPPFVCIIRCILDEKVNRFSQEMFFSKETLPNHFFHSYNTLFLVVSTSTFVCEDISVPYNSWVTQCFSKQFVSWLLDSFFFNWALK